MLPSPDQLRIRRLGAPRVASPLASRGVVLVADELGVLIPSDTEELSGVDGPVPAFEAAGPRSELFLDPKKASIGIVTCGGLCPGTNDVIRAIVLTAWHEYGVRRVLGFRYGYAGLATSSGAPPVTLDPSAVHEIHGLGGTILGSSRGPQQLGDMVDELQRLQIDVLFAIGGDGTLTGASELAGEITRRNLPIAVIGIPKTIDNDILWLERSFGFATAVNEAARSIVAAHTEAHAVRNGIGLVKLMGRYSGFIAAHATLAHNQVNFCLIPESPFSLDGKRGFLSLLERRVETRGHAVIVVAEGAGQEHTRRDGPAVDASGNPRLADIGLFLKERILEHFGSRGVVASSKYIDPSYLIRSLPANAFDSALCLTLGQHAVHAGLSGRTDMLVGTWGGRYTHVPLPLAISERRQLDVEGAVWQRVLEATGQPGVMRDA
ncbi:MAG TPA: ATP-dependent 6-phosphofructokinase [Acidobacteriota bacterium]|nr:ATP-dependent 6-phosphofructokinase [Acidobacteriota bacterium]